MIPFIAFIIRMNNRKRFFKKPYKNRGLCDKKKEKLKKRCYQKKKPSGHSIRDGEAGGLIIISSYAFYQKKKLTTK
jgi:hypothetical protein